MTAKYETVFALSVKTYADEEALNATVEKFKALTPVALRGMKKYIMHFGNLQ